MGTFRLENQDGHFLLYELSAEEELDELSLNMISGSKAKGLLPTTLYQIGEQKTLKYDLRHCVPLEEVLQDGMTDGQEMHLYKAIAHIIERADSLFLDAGAFVLSTEQIFLNKRTSEPLLVCLPTEARKQGSWEMGQLMEELQRRFGVRVHRTDLMNYLKDHPEVTPKEFIKQLEKVVSGMESDEINLREYAVEEGPQKDAINLTDINNKKFSDPLPPKPPIPQPPTPSVYGDGNLPTPPRFDDLLSDGGLPKPPDYSNSNGDGTSLLELLFGSKSDKEAKKAAKLAKIEAQKAAKLAEKEAKLAEKQAEKEAKLAEKQAEKEQKAQEEEARKAEEEALKRAAREAAEKEKKKAAEEMVRKAEEEARKKAEEAARKAEEKQKKAAEEAARQAEEAKRKAAEKSAGKTAQEAHPDSWHDYKTPMPLIPTELQAKPEPQAANVLEEDVWDKIPQLPLEGLPVNPIPEPKQEPIILEPIPQKVHTSTAPAPELPKDARQYSSVTLNDLRQIPMKRVTCMDEDATILQGAGVYDGYAANLVDEDATILTDEDATMLNDEPEAYEELVPRKAYLVREKTGEKILIDKCCFCLGRNGKAKHRPDGTVEVAADYVFNTPDFGISRRHALVVYDGERFYAQDIGAREETFVNGVHLTHGKDVLAQKLPVEIPYAYPLKRGDVIRLRTEGFTFEEEE